MMRFIVIILALIFYSNLAVAQNYYYTLNNSEEKIPENVTIVNNTYELVAGLKSNSNLYLKSGRYVLNSRVNLRNIYNLTLTGAKDVTIEGNLENLIRFEEDAHNLTFKNITFKSTYTAKSVDYGGLVYFNNANAENILFEGCSFTCPDTDTNGLKFVSQGPYRSNQIEIISCSFENIGRMAIETVNHDYDDVSRIENVFVKDCYFNNLGTSSKYGMAVSLSGTGKKAEILDNVIIDAKDRAIENVAWDHVLIRNNKLSSVKNAYNPISMNRRAGGSQYMKHVDVIGNSGTVFGNSPHLNELYHLDGLDYSNNSFNADALHVNDVKNSTFNNNFHSSDGGISLYVEYKSNNNSFQNNKIISTRDHAITIYFFAGATNNVLGNNEVIKKGKGGSEYVDEDGGNRNLDLSN